MYPPAASTHKTVHFLALPTFVVLPSGGMTMRFKPTITGLDVESHESAAIDDCRQEAGSAPCINCAWVNRIPLGNLLTGCP